MRFGIALPGQQGPALGGPPASRSSDGDVICPKHRQHGQHRLRPRWPRSARSGKPADDADGVKRHSARIRQKRCTHHGRAVTGTTVGRPFDVPSGSPGCVRTRRATRKRYKTNRIDTSIDQRLPNVRQTQSDQEAIARYHTNCDSLLALRTHSHFLNLTTPPPCRYQLRDGSVAHDCLPPSDSCRLWEARDGHHKGERFRRGTSGRQRNAPPQGASALASEPAAVFGTLRREIVARTPIRSLVDG